MSTQADRHQFGRAFALSLQPSDPPPDSVPPRILSKLAVYRPPADLVDAYLGEIARGYGVNYVSALKPGEIEGVEPLDAEIGLDDDDEEGAGRSDGTGGAKEPAQEQSEKTPAPPAPTAPVPAAVPRVVKKSTPEDDLAARFERLKKL